MAIEIKIHKSVFYFILLIALFGVLTFASNVYVDYNMMGNDITNATWVNGSFAYINLTWERIYGYPVACPADSAITTLDDSVTCTAYNTGLTWLNSTNLNASGTTYTHVLSVDTALTDAQISDTLTCSIMDLDTSTFSNTLGGGNITADSLSGTQIAELTDADISNTLTASDLVSGSSVVADAEVDDAITIASTTWVNSTASLVKIVYWDLTSTRPTGEEGVCFWNTTAGYKCKQCYNGTNWEGICQGAVWVE